MARMVLIRHTWSRSGAGAKGDLLEEGVDFRGIAGGVKHHAGGTRPAQGGHEQSRAGEISERHGRRTAARNEGDQAPAFLRGRTMRGRLAGPVSTGAAGSGGASRR